MATITAPAPKQADLNDKPINLFQLGVLFVIRASYWPCRAGNEQVCPRREIAGGRLDPKPNRAAVARELAASLRFRSGHVQRRYRAHLLRRPSAAFASERPGRVPTLPGLEVAALASWSACGDWVGNLASHSQTLAGVSGI